MQAASGSNKLPLRSAKIGLQPKLAKQLFIQFLYKPTVQARASAKPKSVVSEAEEEETQKKDQVKYRVVSFISSNILCRIFFLKIRTDFSDRVLIFFSSQIHSYSSQSFIYLQDILYNKFGKGATY